MYVGVGLRHPDCTPTPDIRGASEDVYALGGLWIELDHSAGVHAAQNLPTPQALLAFIEALPFRFSLLVDSGGGYHGYVLFKELWLLDTAEEHQTAALLLRRFQRTIQARAAEQGWKVDSTADLARVLRPAGTLNHKSGTPRPVTILHEDGVRYNPSDIADAPWLGTIDDMYVPASGPANGQFTPTQLEPIVTGCAWLRHCRDDAATLTEPDWYAMLGIAGRCENGEQTAHDWSAPYPRYSQEETARKLHHALADAGPRTCSTIRFDLGADASCRDCQHWGKIKSPIVLGMPTRQQAQRPPVNGTHPADIRPQTTGDDGPFPYSDYTNACALVRAHGQDIRYCWPWHTWLVWTETHWQRDNNGTVRQQAKQTVKRLARLAEKLDDAEAKSLLAHVKKSLSMATLKAMIEGAQDEPGIPVQPEDLDTDCWLLNVANGTVDLKTGTLRPHARADLLTRCIPVLYDPQAPCPTWERFLWRIMGGTNRETDTEDLGAGELEERHAADDRTQTLIGFLQRAIGYSLTGDTREQCLFVLHGSGSNGKSTFLEALQALLEDYAQSTPSASLLAKDRHDGIPNDIARLRGARLVTAVEIGQGKQLNEELIKRLTGQDTLTARFLHAEFFDFRAEFKLFIACNHLPAIKGTDHAIWRRIRLIPFTVTIPETEQDKDLPVKLRAELPGILAWAVRGCLAWQQDSLGAPDAVIQATADYRADMDVVGRFIEECCLVSPHVRVKASALYEAYKQWCQANGEQLVTLSAFGNTLEQRGFARHKVGTIWRLGIGLSDATEEGSRDTRDT
jgi:putative DNA primase/helicase